MFRIYLAGGMEGLEKNEYLNWHKYVIGYFDGCNIFEIVSPARGRSVETLSSREIFLRDRNDVKNCNLIFANMSIPNRQYIGTSMEIAWAKEFEIPVIIVYDENDSIKKHPFLKEIAIRMFKTLDEALDYIDEEIINWIK